jgi:hypothetical protein
VLSGGVPGLGVAFLALVVADALSWEESLMGRIANVSVVVAIWPSTGPFPLAQPRGVGLANQCVGRWTSKVNVAMTAPVSRARVRCQTFRIN